MPLRPHQTVNLIVASVALALLAEGALLWHLSARAPQKAPLAVATPARIEVAPSPAPFFVAPDGAPPALRQTGPKTPPPILPLRPDETATLSESNRAIAKRFFEAGTAALKGKDNARALENFRRVVFVAPDHLPTRLNLALLYLQSNRPAEAIPHLQKAAQLDPKSAAPRFQLAQAYLSLRKPGLALAPLQETVRLAPDERAARALLAQLYAARKRPRDAYQQWSALAQSEPRDVEAHLQAATFAADALKLPREAEKWLLRAQKTTPKDPRAALFLGRLLMAEKQPKRAAAALETGAKINPAAFEIYPALAEARLAAGDLVGARGALQSALLRLPKGESAAQKARIARAEGELRVSLGRVLGLSKQHPLARREFERAARLLPRDAEPRGLLAIAALQSGDKKAAQAALQNALELDPKRARDRLTLAQLLAQTGDFRGADAQFAAYTKAQPRDLGALAQWTEVALRLKQPAKATQILTRIAALDPKNPLPLLQSGAIDRDAGRLAPALANFQSALLRRPNDVNTLFEIARIESTLKRPGAGATWRKIIELKPDYAPAYSALLDASAARGEASGTRLFLAAQLSRDKADTRALSEVLRWYEKKGRAAQAKALLGDIVKRNPDAKSARAALDSFGAAPKVLIAIPPTPAPSKAP